MFHDLIVIGEALLLCFGIALMALGLISLAATVRLWWVRRSR